MLLNLLGNYFQNVRFAILRNSRRPKRRWKTDHSEAAIHRSMEQLEDRTLLAAQLVTSEVMTMEVTPNQEITIPVTYQTFDGTVGELGSPADLQALTLFNLTLHYDSSQLTFVRFDNVNTNDGHQGVNDSLESSVTPDADSSTDRVVQTSFFKLGGSFPGSGTAAELKLFDAVFTVASEFSTSTQLNFVRQATGRVVGGGTFEFVGQGITLEPALTNDTAAMSGIDDTAAKSEIDDTAAKSEIDDTAAKSEIDDTAAKSEIDDTTAKSETDDTAAKSETDELQTVEHSLLDSLFSTELANGFETITSSIRL